MVKTLRGVVEAYDKIAHLYDLMNLIYFFGRDKQLRAFLVEELNLQPGDTVLDLCCGTGLNFPPLRQKIKDHGSVLGVDISSRMFQQAKRKSGSKRIHFLKSDAAYLAFRNETFDAVLLTFCLKITPTYEKTIEEVARVLKSTGRFGVLGNYRFTGLLKPLGDIFSKILSTIAKINFETDFKELLLTKFRIIEDKKKFGGLVQFLVGEKLS